MAKQKSGVVTIFDVAEAAGVSYSTVSRVANGYQFVKPATREKVEAAMAELGYVANLKARSLAGGRSQLYGLLVYDFQTSYLIEIVRGIDDEMAKLEYEMILSTTHHHKQKESQHVQKLSQGMVDGLLIVLPNNLNAYVEDLNKQNVPFVLIDPIDKMERINSVQTTNYQGMYDATSYLIELGHQKIGFITGQMETILAVERLEGFKSALNDNNLTPHPDWIIAGDFQQESGYTAGKQLLSGKTRPTAVLSSNDVMAFGAMTAFQEAGLEVPHDISLIGFDDIPEANYSRPKLTTVRQPLQEMGRTAARLLAELIEKPETETRSIKLPTKLIIRDSTAPPSND